MSALASILRSLCRFHKLLAGIIVLEYALTFAIVMVAVSVLFVRLDAASHPSGIDERNVYVLRGWGIDGSVHRYQVRHAKQVFGSLPGKESLSIASSVPFLGSNSISVPVGISGVAGAGDREKAIQVNAYQVDLAFMRTLGISLVRGRNFLPSEIGHRFDDMADVIMLSQTLAHRLFHGEVAVGRQVMLNDRMVTVVGVTAPLAAPNYLGEPETSYTILLPKIPQGRSVLIFRYAGPSAVLHDKLWALNEHDAGKVNWTVSPYSEIRADYFRSDRAAALALAGVVAIVLIVGLCGIIGLTNYWVGQRRAQIAIRRAVGGRKAHVTAYFLLESAVLVVTGLVIGWWAEVFLAKYFGVLPLGGDPRIWSLSLLLVVAMAMLAVFLSLRRWLRLDPASLMRVM